MKVLVIGGGGREHAIAWRLAQEPFVQVYAAPGNPGIRKIAECIPVEKATPEEYLSAAELENVDLTVVGPEAPLVGGIVDLFRSHGRKIFGPTQAAARLEGSKAFAKEVMTNAGIPTARYVKASNGEDYARALDEIGCPVAIKADGLAAGKGVIIAHTREEAEAAVQSIATTIGPCIVFEEFLTGEEVSFIVLSDGTHVLPLDASQDHKRIFDDDMGPNTGGMGSYSDGRILNSDQTRQVLETAIFPAIEYLNHQGTPFTGFLYAGLMMTSSGPKVLEYNVRLGDPETQSLLHRIKGGFANALLAAANQDLSGTSLEWKGEPSVCVVMAAHGYPDRVRTGDTITGIDEAEAAGAVVFQAGTRSNKKRLETAGGRVLGVTASGSTLPGAIANAYRAVESVQFDGMQFRKDIGRKGLRHW